MTILSMTATFGKLEHSSLDLKPGLNIIHAPNEWGKSTWCAFLTAMLYGVETRSRSTATALADKEKYAPWSGSPMSGRIDLEWKGRKITIERRTRGRVPMGDFRAYETDSGLPVPELTGQNCGEVLIGVEKSVFLRSGFIRLQDLPLTQDEALRRRLNALVTSGDESGTAEALAQKLKDLKNRCRRGRSGLLPEAETRKAELQDQLQQIRSLKETEAVLTGQLDRLEEREKALKNHQAALSYKAAADSALRLQQAEEALAASAQKARDARELCACLPSREEISAELKQVEDLDQAQTSLQSELAALIPPPPAVPVPDPAALADADRYCRMKAALPGPLLLILSALVLLAGVGCLFWKVLIGAGLMGVGLVLLIFALLQGRSAGRLRRQMLALEQKYGSSDPDTWAKPVDNNSSVSADYEKRRRALQEKQTLLNTQIRTAAGNQSLRQCRSTLLQALAQWDTLDQATRTFRQAKAHASDLQSMVRPADPPAFPDQLTFSPEETQRRLSECLDQLRRTQLRLGECRGRIGSLGSEEDAVRELSVVNHRIRQLEDTCTALEIAQSTLAEAAAELQRRFAPRISARAQELFSRMTDSRYDRLTLDEDLSVHAGGAGEDTLHSVLWRSDGTADQLYLALRLAVSEELTPESPLILDDALVRFDDRRLTAVLSILQQQALQRQIILFTCQTREQELLPQT